MARLLALIACLAFAPLATAAGPKPCCTDPAHFHFDVLPAEGSVDFEINRSSPVFEFQSGALDAAQNAIGGGGRYDKLSEEMGGPAAPAIGFGCGIERVLLARAAGSVDGRATSTRGRLDAFVIDAVDSGDANGEEKAS